MTQVLEGIDKEILPKIQEDDKMTGAARFKKMIKWQEQHCSLRQKSKQQKESSSTDRKTAPKSLSPLIDWPWPSFP